MTGPIDAVVMCGGEGTRLDSAGEKPLHEINGVPMVERVVRRLGTTGLRRIHAVTSPHTPETREYVSGLAHVVDAPGEGHVPDLAYAVERLDHPVLSVPCDNVAVPPGGVDRILEAFDGTGHLRVFTPAVVNRSLGMSVNDRTVVDGVECGSTGIRVTPASSSPRRPGEAASGVRRRVTYDVRFAVNVNTLAQARTAGSLLPDARPRSTTAGGG